MKTFRNKVVAISGAASGIGRALAIELAKSGCHLALSDINLEALRQTAVECEQYAVKVQIRCVDVRNRDEVASWAEDSVEKFGTINCIFNNAGVALISPVVTLSTEDLAWVMDVNFWGTVHGTQSFLPHVIASGDGHIVNLSSILGIVSSPTQSAYSASKFAVRGFTEALRMELDSVKAAVGVTCIHLGGVATNIVNSSRIDARIGEFSGRDVESHRASANRTISVTSPERAAKAILRAVKSNARRAVIGPDAKFIYWLSAVFGAYYQKLMAFEFKGSRSGKASGQPR